MPTPTSGVLYVSGGFGIVEFPGGVATLRDGCDYDDGNVIISGGIVRAFDPSDFGVDDHADLLNLSWHLGGHVGTVNRFAWFGAFGDAEYVSVGSGLSVSGGVLSCTLSTLDHAALSNLSWAASGHTSTANRVAVFNGSGAAAVSSDLTFDPVSKELFSTVAIVNGLYLPNVVASRVCVTNGSSLVISSAVTSTELSYLSGVTSAVQTQLNNLSLRVCGRLTLESGVPFSTTSQTAKSTVYFTPYLGDSVPIYDGSAFINRTFTEKSVAVPSTKFCLFDVFAYWNGSAVALEAVDWLQVSTAISAFNAGTQTFTTSSAHGLTAGADIVGVDGITGTVGTDSTYGVNGRVWSVATTPTSTTFTLDGSNLGSLAYTSGGTVRRIVPIRATALTTTKGIYTKSGDATRTYLGTGMTTGTSGQTEMSFGTTEPKLLLWNAYNQLLTYARALDTNSHTYATNAWRYWNNSPANRVVFVNGLALNIEPLMASSMEDNTGYIAYGIDNTSGVAPTLRNGNTALVAMSSTRKILSAAGCHVLSAVEYGESGFTTHYSDLYCSLMM